MSRYISSLFIVILSLSSSCVLALDCQLGNTCPINIYWNGVVDPAFFVLPGPYKDMAKVGTYSCTFHSSNPKVINSILIEAVPNFVTPDYHNFPMVEPRNHLILQNNQLTQVSVVWGHPKKPHSGMGKILLETINQSGAIDPASTKLSITCL